MQITELRVDKLFGRYDHLVPFTPDDESSTRPSVTIMHGPNGIGKTTLLNMLDGMMDLNFVEFRRVPFETARLTFNTDQTLTITNEKATKKRLVVEFDGKKAHLHSEESGPAHPKFEAEVKAFRKHFRATTREMRFELIDTTRLLKFYRRVEEKDPRMRYVFTTGTGRRTSRRAAQREHELSQRVYHFVNEAQANYRRFFAADRPEPWASIVQTITTAPPSAVTVTELVGTLERLRLADRNMVRSGLSDQDWGYAWIRDFLAEKKASDSEQLKYPLTVIKVYLELLDTRMSQLSLLAKRLSTFVKLLSEFFIDKRIIMDAEQGFIIETDEAQRLSEFQLSSGEYHLLYLMVRALVARRRGTVIAIDEPELSMHISWQRKLISALCDCAAGGEPQFLFATHSPDIARSFRDGMVDLGRQSG